MNILEYVCKFLNIHDFVCLYKRAINCINIMEIIVKIKNPKEFDKLAFFISTIGEILIIPKIIIFVNSFDKRVMLINHLYNLLPMYMKKDDKRLIKIFILILKFDIKSKYLNNFCNYSNNIWIYIDAARMRINI